MRGSLRRFCLIASALLPLSAWAGTAVPFTINLSKAVNVVTSGGTPRIAVDVAGTTRYANYTSGSGTSALVFTYQMQAGDVDLDGVAVSSPVQLNGGTIKDLSGNPLTNLTFTPPNTAGVKVNYPSLGMDFTNGAGGRYTLNGTPYTTLASFLTAAGGSFTRASVGTYYDSAGMLQTASANTPRLDYDPVTHAAKGILIEEARTNLLLRSNEFENGAWSILNPLTRVANTTAAPDGTMTADLIYPATTGLHRWIYEGGYSGPPKTYSIYVKAAGMNWFCIFKDDGAGLGAAWFNLSSGTVGAVASGYTASIQNVGNGWYRASVTNPNNTNQFFVVGGVDADNSSTATANGTSGIYVWGAQLEQGAFASSYIPTTTAAVTRAADDLKVNTPSWFNASAGTVFSQAVQFTGSSRTPAHAEIWQDAANKLSLREEGAFLNVAGAGQAIFFTGQSQGILHKKNFTYKVNDFAAYIDGSAAGTDSSGSLFSSPSFMRVGNTDGNASYYYNGWIQKVKYYPARVPNTQLQLMTQ